MVFLPNRKFRNNFAKKFKKYLKKNSFSDFIYTHYCIGKIVKLS